MTTTFSSAVCRQFETQICFWGANRRSMFLLEMPPGMFLLSRSIPLKARLKLPPLTSLWLGLSLLRNIPRLLVGVHLSCRPRLRQGLVIVGLCSLGPPPHRFAKFVFLKMLGKSNKKVFLFCLFRQLRACSVGVTASGVKFAVGKSVV